MEITRFCKCGGSFSVNDTEQRSLAMLEAFKGFHEGADCGECDKATCSAAAKVKSSKSEHPGQQTLEA